MFSLCENMKWSHLPAPGGIYEQSPELLDGFRFIFAERARAEAEEREKQEKDQKRTMRGGRAPTSRPSRRVR